MQFIDEADIYVKAGDGGAGAVAFRREKFVPRGGPAGGDGGNGGDIFLETDGRLTTLLDFRFKREYRARNGEPGRGRDQNGHAAPALVLKVPPGTLVKDPSSGAVLADLREDGVRHVLAKGGRGGLGNMNFATPTLQAPRFAQPGTPGEEIRVRLELRLLADVGLVGFPNAGKSTLVARLSRARPKIADYPFTTLQPHLGVVQYKDARSFVLTDLPGLIEGAAEGAGLGHRFLKHMQRCRAVVHLIDASSEAMGGRDLVHDFDAINRELRLFDPALGRKAQVVAANKIDVPEAREAAERFSRALAQRGIEVHLISGATGEGLEGLLDAVVRELDAAGTAPLLERDMAQPEEPLAAEAEEAPRSGPVAALTEADLAENALPAPADEREEAAREKAARARPATGRRKDGVLKAKVTALAAEGTMPHRPRAARTRAALKALAAAARGQEKAAGRSRAAKVPSASAKAKAPAAGAAIPKAKGAGGATKARKSAAAAAPAKKSPAARAKAKTAPRPRVRKP